MKDIFKKIYNQIKKANKEYIFLFSVIFFAGFLIYSSAVRPQVAPPLRFVLGTFYPLPFGQFNIVQATQIIDQDNFQFLVDPNGTSRFNALSAAQGIRIRVITGTGSGGYLPYSIDLNSGGVNVGVLRLNRVTMSSAGPSDRRHGGKYVWDIAEGMDVKDCEAGDVVIIDDTVEGLGLVKSSASFDPRIAGVISENPKIYMGAQEGKLPLALAGIVLCKVTAENRPIKKGDLLVSASLAGYAMAADPQSISSGMLIGKALEGLKQGRGKIFILVNKQ